MKIEQNKNDLLKEAYQVCMKALVRREYSQKELVNKLIDFDESIVNKCLDMLIEKKYQSDCRYAEMIVNARVNQRYGFKKIELELRKQNINSETISIILEEFTERWSENAIFLVKKKSLNKDLLDYKVANKIKRFLLNRGYSYELINQAINNCIDEFKSK